MCSDKCKCVECMNTVGVISTRGQSSSLFSLATAGQMIASADYHRPERSSSIGSTVEGSEPTSEGTDIESNNNKVPPTSIQQQRSTSTSSSSSSSSSSIQQFAHFKNNHPNLSNRVPLKPSIAISEEEEEDDDDECPLLPISMIKRVCESMIVNISKKVRLVENEETATAMSTNGTYVFVDSESGQQESMVRAVVTSFCDVLKQELSEA